MENSRKSKKKLIITSLLIVALPLVVLVLGRSVIFRPFATSSKSPLDFLESKVKSANYIGGNNSGFQLSSFTLAEFSSVDNKFPKIGDAQISQETTTDETNKSYGREIIPSVLGAVSSYTGSASFSLPIQTPAGPGGINPNVGLSYSSSIIDDSRLGDEYFNNPAHFPVSYTAHGFALNGFASIVRDTRKYPESPNLEGDPYHRFLVNLPTGESFQIKYNPENPEGYRWISIPNSFVRVIHNKPGKTEEQPFADIGSNGYVDAGQFIVKTRDGTSYYFGEEDLASKLDNEGKIKDSNPDNHETWKGTTGGNIYNEFYRSYICDGKDKDNRCQTGTPPEDKATHDGKTKLVVNKWLLQKVIAPNGMQINYTYDVHQRNNHHGNSGPYWLTTTAYPKAIEWNEGKYKVEFGKEDIPGNDKEESIRQRINEISVLVQDATTQKFNLNKKYKLAYCRDGECGIKSFPLRLSFLKSITEVGTDGKSELPPVTFSYTGIAIPGSDNFFGSDFKGAGPSIYLQSVDNGLGGKTTFEYQKYPVDYFDADAEHDQKSALDGRWGTMRTRVSKKTVTDSLENKSFMEEYAYGNALGYAEESGDRDAEDRENARGIHPPTGMQFLGHSSIDIKTYDFTSSANSTGNLLSHTTTNFLQNNQGNNCFEPHPAKGMTSESVVYNGATSAVKTINQYRYRLDGVGDLEVSSVCDRERIDQPLFVYLRRTDTLTQEPTSPNNFIIGSDGALQEAKSQLKSQRRVASENIVFDKYGFLTQSAYLGEVPFDSGDNKGRESDDRYLYNYNLYNEGAWMLGYPYLTYSATSNSCDENNQDCQYGRTEYLYDNSTNLDKQDLDNGYLTETHQYIDKDKVQVSQTKYDKFGNILETLGSKPGDTSTGKSGGRWNLDTVSKGKYDNFYNSLPVETENALGHKVLLEGYNNTLQLPTKIKTQTQGRGAKYATTEMEYDVFGRSVATYSADETNPEKVLNFPSSYTHYFVTPNQPLKVRNMSIVSTHEGSSATPYSYTTMDQLYDGLGNVVQSQLLSTNVLGDKKKIVTNNQFNAVGNNEYVYDVQTSEARDIADLEDRRSNKNTTIISASSPSLENVSKTMVGKTIYDNLGRPIQTDQILLDNNQTFSTKYAYLANASKVTDSKGTQAIEIVDSFGRTTYSITTDASGKNAIIKKYSYDQEFIDSPTKVEISSPNSSEKVILTSEYDRAGRLIKSYDPSLGEHKFSYDINGNQTKVEMPGGNYIELGYDKLGRVISKKFSNANLYNKTDGRKKTIDYTYDTGAYALGQLSKVTDLTGEETYTYDQLGRLVSKVKKIFDNSQEFKTEYNQLSQITKTTAPDSYLDYAYDDEGRLLTMTLNGKETVFTGSSYDKYGNTVESRVLAGNIAYSDKSSYDNLGRLEDLSVSIGSGPQGVNLLSQDLDYNLYGEITQLKETTGTTTNVLDFTYDSLSRLSNVKQNGAVVGEYEYDIYGRMGKKIEGDLSTIISYNNSYPFFAPKDITIDTKLNLLDNPIENEPTYTVAPSASITPAPHPIYGDTGKIRRTTTPTTPQSPQNPNIGKHAFTATYTNKGSLNEDNEACYKYNDLNQLITIETKKNANDKCPLNKSQKEKVLVFYYDHGGNLILQEEYDPNSLSKPKKQTYLFGSYEEIFTN